MGSTFISTHIQSRKIERTDGNQAIVQLLSYQFPTGLSLFNLVNSQQLSPAATINQLHTICLQFGEPFRSAKIKLLKWTPEFDKWKAADILIYHDTLRTILCWPENKEIAALAKKAITRLADAIKKIVPFNKSLEVKLNGSGMAGTEITGRFSYAITRWLVEKFGNLVKLHSSEATPETVRLFFRLLMPSVEYENISSGELSLLQRINKLKATNSSAIEWITNLFESSSLSNPEKEFIFNQLNVFITWKTDAINFNRSFTGISTENIFYHHKLYRAPDYKKIVKTNLPLPARLSAEQKLQLIDMAKATLVLIYRETDPFSFASADAMELFNLEKGYSIGLYSMNREQRLSIESYIGYLVFKNGIPVAYGGGWIFGERCQIGINILARFRGGESAFIFSQLLRVYYQHFGVKRFVVKPYQFGKNNKEALQSGAFWFYYKHGFRPDNDQLQKLAMEELKKRKADKQYRTSISLLKKFTTANMVLLLSPTAVPVFDAALVSVAITNFINEYFDGNREKALLVCERKTKKELSIKTIRGWSNNEKKTLQQWSLLVQATLLPVNWKNSEKKLFVQLIKVKGNTREIEFIKLSQKHQRFWKELSVKFS